MTAAEKAIRWSTITTVVIVAGVAASFSYQHALDVIEHYSRPSRLNTVFPLMVDGLIYCGSMVLLNDARRGLDAHKLAYWMLGIGIAATLTVNAVSGLAYGLVGAVIAGWPAVALVLSYEGLMLIFRRSSAAPASEPAAVHPFATSNGHAAPHGGSEAAEMYAAELARGQLPSVRRLQREMHLGQPRAREVRSYLDLIART